jgi:flagellar biosynthesis protein
MRYNQGHQDAPELVAGGYGEVAEKIIQLAEEAGIPVLEDPILAQALAGLEVGSEVPPELYLAAAEALIWAWRSDQKLRGIAES